MTSLGYYHSLKPFRQLFQTGTPILTYHKLGPRPSRVRLKGLYVSEKLFTQQLAELHAAGFVAPVLSDLLEPNPSSPQRIGLTFDDGFTNVLRYGLAPLAHYQFRATQFIVANRIGQTNDWDVRHGEASESLMDVAQIREWLAAGHQIGSHSLTHPHLTKISLAAAREEIFSSKKKLEDRFGLPVEHFCYPYGDYNEAVRDLVQAAGYQTACTTVSGVNLNDTSPWELKRFTARYRSLNWRAIWSRFRWLS
jgi:peptidoglycan/xylan/chitin deacetylase (PgdA/CDA1 family)